jgi:hypothetical protein
LTGSNCLTADGTLYIAAAHLAGTETVVSSGGTSTPTISAGRIDFTAGTCWDLTLSDGTHYPLSEGGGIGIYDDSGANNHGILTSATLASAWAGSQDEYHNNIIRGHGKRMYFDGVGNYIEVAGMAATVDYFGSCTISAKIILEEIPASPISIFSLGGSYRLFINSAGEYALNSSASPTGVSASIGLSEVSCEFDVLGRATSLSINGVIVWTGSAGSANPSIFFSIGAREISGYNFFFKGSIYDVSITGSSVKNFSLYGYGNQDADWFDITGTVDDSDISVNGSPSSMYLPAKTSSVDIFDQPLTHPAGDYHNGAETKVDFNPDSTPEMGATQLGITVPSAHAFGDAFASSDQIFSRQRTKTEDRFLVFTEAQTGSALTNIQKYTQP